jgi:hypothetical protein
MVISKISKLEHQDGKLVIHEAHHG